MTAELPGRCLQLCFGDINDDVGLKKGSMETMKVDALAVGEARHGLEKFVGSKSREFCEKMKEYGILQHIFKFQHI